MNCKTILTIMTTLFCTAAFSKENDQKRPAKIDQITENIPVIFKALNDPCLIVLEYGENSKEVETYYDADKHFEILSKWEKEQKSLKKKRKIFLRYTTADGVELIDKESQKVIKLPGYMKYHPIDYAKEILDSKFYTTYGMIENEKFVRKSWDCELNRIYKHLGGAKNIPLRDMQRQWIKFRDTQIEFLADFYRKKQGTMYNIIHAWKVTNIYRKQTEFLQKLLDY